ncbi:metallophosphoesterase family protein [Paenibacillus methanolicus]|uniref:DNA repair exonuclease SbcCD nuclease subunit n=1 Tax=Paenibacillus methanolicus TaxID=582686 RepID=A0A5S5C2U3_9BACL|nr:DNA repair exonuclease [Paenibacillus methanolicus]TYP73741.1 DNA repair exonuclease SbcCD nuclease subunit [Paenibacillus methanolicus]
MGIRFRFIHAADLHVDSPFRGLTEAPAHVRAALGESTFDAVRRLTEAAIAHRADFIVISGDLYDGADRSLRAQLTLRREWEKLHAHGVQLFVIHGNHDHLSGSRANLEQAPGVHVFASNQEEGYARSVPAYTREGDVCAYVHGISYGARAVNDNLATRYRARQDGTYEIALLHGNVDGDGSHDPYAPCSLRELTGMPFQYWALGHIHGRAVLHRDPYVVYAGNTQGRHIKETGAKGCYVVDVAENHQTELTFVPLDTVRWAVVEVDIGNLATEHALIQSIEDALIRQALQHEGRASMIRVRLAGRGALHAKLLQPEYARDLTEGLRAQLEMRVPTSEGENGWIWLTGIEVGTNAELNVEALREEDSFAGELFRSAEELLEHPGLMAELAEEAAESLRLNTRIRRMLRELTPDANARIAREAAELALSLVAGADAQHGSGTGEEGS